VLRGCNGEDILIGGTTDHDDGLDALAALLAEWRHEGQTTPYLTRIGHLNGSLSGGQNGDAYLNAATVRDDGAVDDLFGEANSDWFLIGLADRVRDRSSGEQVAAV
jgi:hypothetical protein